MGFFENIGANNPVSRILAEIVRTIHQITELNPTWIYMLLR